MSVERTSTIEEQIAWALLKEAVKRERIKLNKDSIDEILAKLSGATGYDTDELRPVVKKLLIELVEDALPTEEEIPDVDSLPTINDILGPIEEEEGDGNSQ